MTDNIFTFESGPLQNLRKWASTPRGQFELNEIWKTARVPEYARTVLMAALFDRQVHADLLGPRERRSALLSSTSLMRSRPRGIALPAHTPGVIPTATLHDIAETARWPGLSERWGDAS